MPIRSFVNKKLTGLNQSKGKGHGQAPKFKGQVGGLGGLLGAMANLGAME